MAAGKTGSGKTLCFVIPIIETLHRMKWSTEDGIGAIVLTPTRELAIQIYELIGNLGQFESSVGLSLLIGGKNVKNEANELAYASIIVATPGRLLQHMDESVDFDARNLHMLVLDEADRILDAGFKDTVNAILENLSFRQQTMLFSATQTK